MKLKRLLLLITLVALLLSAAAQAEAALTAQLQGNTLRVTWNVGGAGEATLTLYQDNWPTEVLRVPARGSLERTVNAAHRYSARLNAAGGCLTANAAETATSEPTPVPTPIPTVESTPEPTPILTAIPTAEPTAEPTPIPTPTVAPTATPSFGTNQGDLAAQVAEQVNAERAKAGLGALRVDSELTRAAQVRAREIVDKFSHTRPDGTAWSTVSDSAYGENIAMGQQTADKVMAAWMSSQGHRENILRASFGSIGVAAYRVGGVMYWVQLFGK